MHPLPLEASAAPRRERLRSLVESRAFGYTITAVILLNAATLGLETWPPAVAAAGQLLAFLDRAALILFTVEIALRLWVYRARFFTGGWNLFDFTIVAISWIPAAGAFSVLRAMRVLRVLRLISVVPQMRTVVGALFGALPGMMSIVASNLAVCQLSTVGAEQHPQAWLFFVPFVIVTSFAVLNLFIALIVNSMQTVHERDLEQVQQAEGLAHAEREQLMKAVQALHDEVRELRTRWVLENDRKH